jgi:hypothetical protein
MSGDSPFRFDIKSKKEGEDPKIIGSFKFLEPVEVVCWKVRLALDLR